VLSGCLLVRNGSSVRTMRKLIRGWKLLGRESDAVKLEDWAQQLEQRSGGPDVLMSVDDTVRTRNVISLPDDGRWRSDV
jgi:hypothetical protein